MSEWEEFNNTSRPIKKPLASIIEANRITFNKEAAALIGDHRFVELLFNERERKIGLRLKKKESGRSRKLSRGHHGLLIHVARFFSRYGINGKREKGKRYLVEKEKDLLVICLDSPIK